MKKLSYDLWEAFLGRPDPEPPESVQQHSQDIPKLMRRIIQEALTERQKTILNLYFYDSLSVTQIAGMLNLDKSTVSRTLKRAVCNVGKYITYYK